MRSSWVTIRGTTKQEEKARRNRAANQTIRQLASMGAIGAKMLLCADQKSIYTGAGRCPCGMR